MKPVASIVAGVLTLGLAVVGTPTAALAKSITIYPGQSIQAAVDAASPGDTVKVMPGDYIEPHGNSAAVRITKRLKLLAKSKLPSSKVRILPNPDQPNQRHGILVEPANDGDPDVERVKIKGFTIEGFEKNGIWLRYVDNFKIEGNESINNLENGIFPTLSANGLVKKNVSYGSLDSGLWVEASENVRVIRNELYNNPTGLEITVSKNVVAKNNDVHDNTVGVGLYHPNGASLPPLGNDGDWEITNNKIYNNNLPNPVSGGLVGSLPPGIGVLVIGVDRVTVLRNQITGNSLHGITLVDWCLFNDCVSDPPVVEDASDNNEFLSNTITGNGAGSQNPDFIGLEADVLNLSAGVGNCFGGNTIGSSIGPLPPC
jgi:parallel beta-helix repeat protein